MAISFVNKSTFASGTAGLTVAAVAGVAADDLILLFVESANENIATPTGFTQVTNSPVSTGTAAAIGGVRLAVFYQWATGADTTTSVADSGNHTTAIKMAFRGVDPTTPFDATPVSGIKATASTTATFPGITTATANAWIVHASALDLDANSTATTGTPTNANLTGLTEQHDQTISGGVGGGLVVITGELPTAGATGNTTATVTSTIQVYLTMALRPFVELQQLTLTADVAAVDVVGLNVGLTRQFPALTADAATFALSGEPAALFKGVTLVADAAAFTTTDEDAVLRAAFHIDGNLGAFDLSGQDAVLRPSRRLTADTASFDLAGLSADVERHYRLTADVAGFTHTGIDAGVGRGYRLMADVADFTVTGLDADIPLDLAEPPPTPEVNGAELLWYEILGEPIPALFLAADPGAFDVAGQDAKVLYGRTVSAPAAGAFSLAGQDAGFRRTYSLKADVAAFTEAGIDANLRTARRLVSDPTAFAHAGLAAGVLYGRVVGAAQASFTLNGVDATFKFQRFLRPILANLTLTGEAATLFKSLRFRADGGQVGSNLYSEAWESGYTTAEADLLRQYKTVAAPAAFSLAVFDATFRKTKLFIADGGSFSLTGEAANARTARRLTAATVGFDLQPYDASFSWQHVMRPVPAAFDLAGVDAALKKVIYFYADQGEFSVQGFDSRPFFSSLPQARDYVVRPMELRGITRPEEVRVTSRQVETATSLRPAEDHSIEHQ